MVADGMSLGTLTLADLHSRLHLDRESHWIAALRRPGARRALLRTESANSSVTDSSAAATCWSIGRKVRNGALNITEDGSQHVPLLVHAAQSGKATGLVSTTRITHATPAAFIANVPRRDWEGPIGRQMMERRADVLLGGGARFFPPSLLGEHADTRVIRTRDELLQNRAAGPAHPRLLGLFADSHIPFALDRPAGIPTLSEMTRAALAHLGPRGGAEGFILQVEGGRIDHAAHSNDAATLIREQVEFDEAIAAALSFTEGRDDTLVILTTDHGNANPGLTLYGREGDAAFARIAGAKHSFEWVMARLKRLPDSDARRDQAPALLAEASGCELDPKEAAILRDALGGARTSPFLQLGAIESVMGGLLANHFGVGFVSGNHTADMVEATVIAPAAGRHTGAVPPVGHLTGLHALITSALALDPAAARPLDDMKDRIEFPAPPPND
jgi:alkaline phosphatase